MYNIQLKTREKVLLITIEGLMTEKDSIAYVDDLKMSIRKINPSEYDIIADLKKLKTSPQNLITLIERSIALIADTPFRKRYSIIPESPTAFLQLKRIGNSADKFVFVESYEKIHQLIA